MDRADEYYLWAMKAITEPANSNRCFYYFQNEDELFGLKMEDGNFFPILRNPLAMRDTRNFNQWWKQRKETIHQNDPGIIRLPTLSYETKRDFLLSFNLALPDSSIKLEWLSLFEGFKNTDTFYTTYEWLKKDFPLYHTFDMQRGKFIIEQVQQMFEPLGISERSRIVW